MVYDLTSDPGENVSLLAAMSDICWMILPALTYIAEFEKSVAEYPNIQPGQDFDGYDIM